MLILEHDSTERGPNGNSSHKEEEGRKGDHRQDGKRWRKELGEVANSPDPRNNGESLSNTIMVFITNIGFEPL